MTPVGHVHFPKVCGVLRRLSEILIESRCPYCADFSPTTEYRIWIPPNKVKKGLSHSILGMVELTKRTRNLNSQALPFFLNFPHSNWASRQVSTITMTAHSPTLRKPPRALLCIHGAGGSAAVFRVQLAKLSAALRNDFQLVYVTAPFPSDAGPGVLPLFQDMGPFYTWFAKNDGNGSGNNNDANEESNTRIEERVRALDAPINKVVQDWQETSPESPIVGVVAFSEGALVATLLLWQQQMGRLPWLPTLSIAMFICCYYRDEVTEYIKSASPEREADSLIKVPTLHLQGRQDFGRDGSRKLAETHYTPRFAHVLEFQGTHQFPNRRPDIEETVKRFLELHRKALATGSYR